jgi:hypothetical protein
MTYKLHRVFCATPGNLEPERQAFHDVIGQVNEAEAMAKSILFVPVSIVPNMVNKLALQPMVEANVEWCTFFVLVLQNTWGPPGKNFEAEYNLARRLKSDPDAEMKGVSLFFKAADGLQVDPAVLQLRSSMHSRQDHAAHDFASYDFASYEFASMEVFKEQLRVQLTAWMRMVET